MSKFFRCPCCGNPKEGTKVYRCKECGKFYCVECGNTHFTSYCPHCKAFAEGEWVGEIG